MAALLGTLAVAQTTQGIISGRVVNSQTGRPIPKALVRYANAATGASGTGATDEAGYFCLPLLSPGSYSIHVDAESYQSQGAADLRLDVAGALDIDFRLRPLNDIWERGEYRSIFLPGSKTILTFYGPDVDTSRSTAVEVPRASSARLESTMSEVILPGQLAMLPLAGRDVYTLLVTQPAVTADTTTARGLGLSVSGQRPSSSNFLLDGLENNNHLVTGPLTAIAPEAIQEYRISTNNYSAQYGRTSGFVANAITRAGTSEWHGIAYAYLKNEVLNANTFQRNLGGLPRAAAKELEPGYQVGGPLVWRERLFVSSAFERLRSRTIQSPVALQFPTLDMLAFTDPGGLAYKLLSAYPPPQLRDGGRLTASRTLVPPLSVDRSLALERLDYRSPAGAHRITGRVALARLSRPDFIWSPYSDFTSGMKHNSVSAGVDYVQSWSAAFAHEAKIGYQVEELRWDRAHPEIPTLVSLDATMLPGSPVFYAYRNRNRGWEVSDNLIWTRGRHILTAGGGLFIRATDGYMSPGRDGQYLFRSALFFAIDQPSRFSAAVDRTALPEVRLPDFNRRYRSRSSFAFAQDTFHVLARLTLNYGIRLERYGSPRNVGTTKDALVTFGSRQSFAEHLAAAGLSQDSSDERLFGPDTNNVAVRFGFSWDASRDGRTVVRGAYGTFFDRAFDNLWQNLRLNNLILPTIEITEVQPNYLAPVASVLSRYTGPLAADFPSLTLIDPGLRTPYSHSYFAGVQRTVTERFVVEANGLGALGRRLVTTDVVNRPFRGFTGSGRLNPELPDVLYRAGQGLSSYYGLALIGRYRGSRAQVQAAYTLSHAIDLQSDPLEGEFFDLSFTRVTSGTGRTGSSFARESDASADRGNSDFDQRHNVVLMSWFELPAPAHRTHWTLPLRNWQLGLLAAFRSGFPYTVHAPSAASSGTGQILNNRADVLDPDRAVLESPVPVTGGQRLLDRAAFGQPGAGQLGNSGRNAFRGPGLYNLDVSIGRSFGLPPLGDSGMLNVRADVFNLLNHANLNNPDSLISSPAFGVAYYGRLGRESTFPAFAPLNEGARTVQLSLRIQF
ncbi:MAG TPA: carboxypeptidase regulatory-like domain-containing protein [Bryobacteraceae bacterium]|nr:carboxypeptidase regulatory-like domain-containing protein [Bryobacteraceae bacterium]